MLKDKRESKAIYTTAIEILLVGSLTGITVGVVVSFYNILAALAEVFSEGAYAFLREKPYFIPLLFLALFVCAVGVGTLMKLVPMIRGNGVPQTEGAAMGVLRFRWFQTLCSSFAASLLTIFMGLSGDSEGPSLLLGGVCGAGVGSLTKRNPMIKRYQITGGASAGLAVAVNAPLTGMAFAFEEAQKRFSPNVFICAFSSVVTGLITRNLIRSALSLPVTSVLSSFSLSGMMDLSSYGYVLLCAILVSLLGVGFYHAVFFTQKLFHKITFWKGRGKLILAFLLGGTFSLISVHLMGGGREFLEALGSLSEEGVHTIFSLPLVPTLMLVVAMRFLVTVVNVGADVPCGIVFPMLTIGAGVGALLARLCVAMGMDASYTDLLILICMATFFSATVKAPITAIVMVVEFTWNFTFLLPVSLGVAVGYLVGTMLKTEPIYERMLHRFVEEYQSEHPMKQEKFTFTVGKGSLVDGYAIREISFPGNVNVISVRRGEIEFFTTGATVLLGGDEIKIETLTDDREEMEKGLLALLKPAAEKKKKKE